MFPMDVLSKTSSHQGSYGNYTIQNHIFLPIENTNTIFNQFKQTRYLRWFANMHKNLIWYIYKDYYLIKYVSKTGQVSLNMPSKTIKKLRKTSMLRTDLKQVECSRSAYMLRMKVQKSYKKPAEFGKCAPFSLLLDYFYNFKQKLYLKQIKQQTKVINIIANYLVLLLSTYIEMLLL